MQIKTCRAITSDRMLVLGLDKMYVLHMHLCTLNELFYVQVTEPIPKLPGISLLKLLKLFRNLVTRKREPGF